jgi:hypothetical protein
MFASALEIGGAEPAVVRHPNLLLNSGTAVNMPVQVGQEVVLQFVEESEAGIK